jgi:hypothetical protein
MEASTNSSKKVRYALAPYTNQFVLGQGWVAGWEDFSKHRRYYIKNPTIKRADKNTLFKDQRFISKEDHINVFIPHEENAKKEELLMYENITFSGLIKPYNRKDRSFDYSVHTIPSSYIEDILLNLSKDVDDILKEAGRITPDTLLCLERYVMPTLKHINEEMDEAGDLLPTFNGTYDTYKDCLHYWEDAIRNTIKIIRSISGNRKFRRRYDIDYDFAKHIPSCI